MEHWLQETFNLLPAGGLFVAAVFLIAFFEALVGIGLIMPGSVLTVFSGWLSFQGKAPIELVMAAAACGALAGDLLSYWLGARFGIHLWDWRVLKKRRHLLRLAEVFFIEHGGKGVFFGRFLGPIRGLIPFVAGASQMRPLPFTVLFSDQWCSLGHQLPGAWLSRRHQLAARRNPGRTPWPADSARACLLPVGHLAAAQVAARQEAAEPEARR